MRYKKRLNNNAVVALDDASGEHILVGRGLGFQIEVGAVVDESKVEKAFVLKDESASQQLQKLLEAIPVGYVDVAERVYVYATDHLASPISDSVIVHLADHLFMAVERARQGMSIQNMMLPSIQRFYRDEYLVGRVAVDLASDAFGVQFTDDEAGFIALHLVNAQLGSGDSRTSLTKITTVVAEIERIVRLHFATDFDPESTEYRRFVTHCTFFAERLFQDSAHRTGSVGGALESIRASYPEADACVTTIGEFLNSTYQHPLTGEETLYLTIHIAHMINASR